MKASDRCVPLSVDSPVERLHAATLHRSISGRAGSDEREQGTDAAGENQECGRER